MSALADYAEVQIRGHMFRTLTFSKPSTIGICLCTSATADANTGATIPEVANSNAYARQGLAPADANWSAPDSTGGVTANVAAITFPTATGSWGTVTHVALTDSTTYGSGNALLHGALTASKAVALNDVFQFAAGNLQVTFA